MDLSYTRNRRDKARESRAGAMRRPGAARDGFWAARARGGGTGLGIRYIGSVIALATAEIITTRCTALSLSRAGTKAWALGTGSIEYA